MKTALYDTELAQVTLRLRRTLRERARTLAKARGTSVNALVQMLLEELDRRDREAELVQVYETLGQSTEADVTPFFKAQAEVAKRG